VKAEQAVLTLNRELDSRVQERIAQLEAVNAELEAFSYSVSHDLRAPLRAIDGWGRALEEDCGSRFDERAHDYLSRIRNETFRMGQLIDGLLGLSRTTRKEMNMQRVDLAILVHRVASQLRDAEPNRNVSWNIQQSLRARGDAALLEVVLTNLLGNAWKFTSRKSHAVIEVGQTDLNGERPYFVRDNGAGFSKAYSEKLFTAFARMHSHAEFPGTGIGLATVQRIIARHGGRIWVDAEPDKGATFYFTLP
jgi:light-regulated signal transduction histidine kinase (bacteriophytochrome)